MNYSSSVSERPGSENGYWFFKNLHCIPASLVAAAQKERPIPMDWPFQDRFVVFDLLVSD